MGLVDNLSDVVGVRRGGVGVVRFVLASVHIWTGSLCRTLEDTLDLWSQRVQHLNILQLTSDVFGSVTLPRFTCPQVTSSTFCLLA